jgi:hypothetical protein
LLLNGETTVTPFINDASSNSLNLTVNGDVRPILFNPYQGDGYYSNYFDGTGDYLTAAANTAFVFGTGDFTIEGWFYPVVTASGQNTLVSWIANDGNTSLDIQYYTGSVIRVGQYNNYPLSGTNVISINRWNHFAITRQSGTLRIFTNGTLDTTTTFSTNLSASNQLKIGYNGYNDYFNGYIFAAHCIVKLKVLLYIVEPFYV